MPDGNEAAAAAAGNQSGAGSRSTGGAFKIYPADIKGERLVHGTDDDPKRVNPSDEDAVDIYFALLKKDDFVLPKEQLDLQTEIARVLRTVTAIYLVDNKIKRTKFRIYYARLFRVAQIGLEGPNASPDTARVVLSEIIADLLIEEAGNVKNRHMKRLGYAAVLVALPCIAFYLALWLTFIFDSYLQALNIELAVLANFMLLLTGCFCGVWLSYAIRSSSITINELIVTDTDRLTPVSRLMLAGIFTTILGLFFVYEIIDIKVGNFSASQIATEPIVALLIGIFCGISELALPDSVGKKAVGFIASIK